MQFLFYMSKQCAQPINFKHESYEKIESLVTS